MPLFEQDSIFATIPIYQTVRTIYQRFGNWLAYLCIVFIFLVFILQIKLLNSPLDPKSENIIGRKPRKPRNSKKSRKKRSPSAGIHAAPVTIAQNDPARNAKLRRDAAGDPEKRIEVAAGGDAGSIHRPIAAPVGVADVNAGGNHSATLKRSSANWIASGRTRQRAITSNDSKSASQTMRPMDS